MQVNNYLKFAMQLFFKPTTAKMLSNLKVHTLRTHTVCMLHKRTLHTATHAVAHHTCCSC